MLASLNQKYSLRFRSRLPCVKDGCYFLLSGIYLLVAFMHSKLLLFQGKKLLEIIALKYHTIVIISDIASAVDADKSSVSRFQTTYRTSGS